MKKGYIYIALTTILFSTMEIALKGVSHDFNPMQLTFTRFFIGGIILLPFAIRTLKAKSISLKLADIAAFSLTGFICVVVSMTFYQLAILYSQPAVVAVLFSCNPIFVAVLAFFILREKIYTHTIISLVLCVLGIVAMINPFHVNVSLTGITFSILSAITFALYSVVGKKQSVTYGVIPLSCFSFILGSCEMLILILLSNVRAIANALNGIGLSVFANISLSNGYSWNNILPIIYVSIFVTGLGYTFYFLSMRETSATTALMVFYIKPALSPILALAILGDIITSNMYIGILFIIVGSLFSFIPDMRMNKKEIANSK